MRGEGGRKRKKREREGERRGEGGRERKGEGRQGGDVYKYIVNKDYL